MGQDADVSHLLRARGRQVTLWGGGVKHNVKMKLFSAKIVWTSPLNEQVAYKRGVAGVLIIYVPPKSCPGGR